MKQVYFIVCGGKIKVGYTARWQTRRQNYVTQFGSIEELGIIYGDRDVERAAHKSLVRHRLHGEWFQDTPEARTAILNIIETAAPPPQPPPRQPVQPDPVQETEWRRDRLGESTASFHAAFNEATQAPLEPCVKRWAVDYASAFFMFALKTSSKTFEQSDDEFKSSLLIHQARCRQGVLFMENLAVCALAEASRSPETYSTRWGRW